MESSVNQKAFESFRQKSKTVFQSDFFTLSAFYSKDEIMKMCVDMLDTVYSEESIVKSEISDPDE